MTPFATRPHRSSDFAYRFEGFLNGQIDLLGNPLFLGLMSS